MNDPLPVIGIDTPPLDARVALHALAGLVSGRVFAGVANVPASSTSIAVTGVGFRPVAIFAVARFTLPTQNSTSTGVATPARSWNVFQTATGYLSGGSDFVYLDDNSHLVRATVSAFGADGFTLSFASAQSASIVSYLCVG